MKNKKIIFDFGCNEGQNIKYFLKKADYVICVDGNSNSIKKIKNKFKKYVGKRVFLENIVLSANNGLKEFYISKKYSILSTVVKPDKINDFKKIITPSINPIILVNNYLKKFSLKKIEYIKIDLENYDHIILKNLFKKKIFPKYLSVEVHNPKTLSLILKSPYQSYKIVEGKDIGNKIKKIKIYNLKKKLIPFTFLKHSSGPYGDDIPGYYLNKNLIMQYFNKKKLGWKDLSCSLQNKIIQNQDYLLQNFFNEKYILLVLYIKHYSKIIRHKIRYFKNKI